MASTGTGLTTRFWFASSWRAGRKCGGRNPSGNRRFLCLGEFGHLLWVDLSPEGYKGLDRAQLFLAGESWTPPALSRGLLYVCQNTPGSEVVPPSPQRLLCYDLRGAADAPAAKSR